MGQLYKSLKLLVFLISAIAVFVFPKQTHAAPLGDIFTSPDSIFVKVQETVEYLFAFKVENKVPVLEKHAEKRLVAAQGYAEEGKNERVQNMIQSYQQIKEKQNNLLGKVNDGEVLGMVAERTVEQQKTMEAIKTRIDEGTKQQVIQVQERVVNQVAKRVIDVNGKEGATEFVNEVAHVWAPGTGPGGGEAGLVVVGGSGEGGIMYAPGTGPGGTSGWTYAGGGKLIYAAGTGPGAGGVVIEGGEMKFAPGTSGSGSGGTDVKNVEVKTGGGSDGGGTTVESSNQNNASDNTPGGNTIEGGSRDYAPGTTSGGESGIAP